jgi:two-component system cell cycle sensor histidine kinase/response regulator CckA
LLVEDDPVVRRMARLALSEDPYQILEAGDGAEAFEVANNHDGPIDLLVSDVVMPHVSGPELARELRKRFADLRILFTSGYIALPDDSEFANDPQVCFVKKPFTIDGLRARLNELRLVPAV